MKECSQGDQQAGEARRCGQVKCGLSLVLRGTPGGTSYISARALGSPSPGDISHWLWGHLGGVGKLLCTAGSATICSSTSMRAAGTLKTGVGGDPYTAYR